MKTIFDNVVLIPSLHPDHLLSDYIDSLVNEGFKHILVVDDGSGSDPKYQDIFNHIARYDQCQVIGYEVNKGKGFALKYGYKYIKENYKDIAGIISADSDGQHTAEDVKKLVNELLKNDKGLILGSRDFNEANIPSRSRFGNKTTSFFFKLLYGSYLPDTQTGLRAFAPHLIDFMTDVPGNRFEYEMNVLVYCAVQKIPFYIVPIKTIYLEENKSSHFRPLQDSIRIYKVLFKSFFKYLTSSLFCFLVDIGVFTLLNLVIIPALASIDPNIQRYISAFVGRIISASVNFMINKNKVFTISKSRSAFQRYALLALGSYFASTTILNALVNTASGLDSLYKIIIDTLLYIINYRVQQAWVFNDTKKVKG